MKMHAAQTHSTRTQDGNERLIEPTIRVKITISKSKSTIGESALLNDLKQSG